MALCVKISVKTTRRRRRSSLLWHQLVCHKHKQQTASKEQSQYVSQSELSTSSIHIRICNELLKRVEKQLREELRSKRQTCSMEREENMTIKNQKAVSFKGSSEKFSINFAFKQMGYRVTVRHSLEVFG